VGEITFSENEMELLLRKYVEAINNADYEHAKEILSNIENMTSITRDPKRDGACVEETRKP
jgi:hypothetical protein